MPGKNALPKAPAFMISRDVAQLVARTAGGREVAGSSPVIPTIFIAHPFGWAINIFGIRFEPATEEIINPQVPLRA